MTWIDMSAPVQKKEMLQLLFFVLNRGKPRLLRRASRLETSKGESISLLPAFTRL